MPINLRRVAYVFICQSGRLELEAAVLAASLRRVLGETAEIIAAIPGPPAVMGTVRPNILDFLCSLSVRIAGFHNELAGSRPQTCPSALFINKAYCLRVDTDADVIVVLDSDQLCRQLLDPAVELAVPMVGRRVGYPGARAVEGRWQRIFDVCEAELPRCRFRITSNEPDSPALSVPPYFNSGFISLHRSWAWSLSELYIDCYRRIARHDLLGMHRYYNEQVALAVAVQKARVPYEVAAPSRIDASFVHYMQLHTLAQQAPFARLVRQLADASPTLDAILRGEQGWRDVLAAGNAAH